ncbi:MAG: tRNA-guanine transglycosylase DpdA [Nitrososphaerota archaeon]
MVKYFIPEWDDRVDPEYNFVTDNHSKIHSQDPLRNDVYIWNIYGLENVPIDGVLVSRMKIMENKIKYQQILSEGIHNFLRLPQTFEIMGDCGAWGYIDEEEPPFKTSETLDYYVNCGFNYGVSVDHLIVPAYFEQKEKRWNITIENAREMFELWQSKDKYLNSIRIIGVAQGWDVESYRKAVRELLKIGYDYIGLGGLARSPTGKESEKIDTKTLINVVKGVWLEVKKWMEKTKRKVDIHIFGVARPQIIPQLMKYGVTSFDSASFLRRAWLSAQNNYHTLDGKSYSAIRIPQTERSPRVKEIKNERLVEMERKALEIIRLYDQGKASLEEVMKVLTEYDKLIGQRPNIEKFYVETLKDMPWKKCPCIICKNIGVEVIIFRGNNRNRRRGFHNTFVFYKKLRELSPRILAFTTCTAKKDENPNLIPAFQRYLPSPVFKVFWDNVFDLPVEIGILSAKFGLIDWSKRIPYYDYKMQETDVPKFVEELKEKLRRYDKIFFIGLGLYRDVVQKVKDETGYNIEIFPRLELTEREKVDIIEYTKQIKLFREAIIRAIPEKCRPGNEIIFPQQPTLERFIEKT